MYSWWNKNHSNFLPTHAPLHVDSIVQRVGGMKITPPYYPPMPPFMLMHSTAFRRNENHSTLLPTHAHFMWMYSTACRRNENLVFCTPKQIKTDKISPRLVGKGFLVSPPMVCSEIKKSYTHICFDNLLGTDVLF